MYNVSLEHLKEKALHALFGLRKHANFSKLKPSLACKIFAAIISPISSYNSEIWGVYVKHDFKSWDNTPIEKNHVKFCKRYPEISHKVSNVSSRSELGRLPLIINIYKNIPYFILYLLRKNEDILLLNKPFVPRKSFTIMVKIAFTIILSKYLNILTCPILILII